MQTDQQVAAFKGSVRVSDCSCTDMPISYFWLNSGRRKRRVDVYELSTIIAKAVAEARAADASFDVVIEKPTPLPGTDGWQSAALSGVATSIACKLQCALRLYTPALH